MLDHVILKYLLTNIKRTCTAVPDQVRQYCTVQGKSALFEPLEADVQ